MDDFIDIIDLEPEPEPTPSPTTPPARKRTFVPAPKTVRKYDRRERERDERYLPAVISTNGSAKPVPPNSPEVENGLIGECLFTGNDTVSACLDGKVTPQSFYVPANREIFEVLLSLYNDKRPISTAVVMDDLRARGLIEGIGGPVQLAQLEGKACGLAYLSDSIARVRNYQVRREIIAANEQAIERAHDLGSDLHAVTEAINDAARVIDEATTPVSSLIRPLDTFTYPLNDPDCLIGAKGRYLGRGGSLLIPAPAGIGKSTASYQMAACWGTGRDFLGLSPVGALRILIVQVEDDDGDVGEMFTSVQQGLGLTQKEQAMIRQNVAVVRDRASIGEHFPAALRRYVRHFRPDIVIINPLMRYCPGLSKEEIAGPFLSQVDALADEFGFACVAFHHTPKPPVQDGTKGKPVKKDAVDRQYTAFGSSALTNWPRAIINIAKVRGHDGVFVFQLDKRGKRAGLTRPVPGGNFDEAVTELVVKHSTRQIEVQGRKFPMVLWEVHENQDILKEAEEAEAGAQRSGPRPTKRTYTEQEILAQFPFGEKDAQPLPNIKRKAMANLCISETKFGEEKFNLMTAGFISAITLPSGEQRYYRVA